MLTLLDKWFELCDRLDKAVRRVCAFLADGFVGLLWLSTMVPFLVGGALEFWAALVWCDIGVYTSPALGRVFPGLWDVCAPLLDTKPWLTPAISWVLELHIGVIGGLLSWVLVCLLVSALDEGTRMKRR